MLLDHLLVERVRQDVCRRDVGMHEAAFAGIRTLVPEPSDTDLLLLRCTAMHATHGLMIGIRVATFVTLPLALALPSTATATTTACGNRTLGLSVCAAA